MGDPGAYISKTTWARDFKFAGALVQRLYLVLVVIAKFFFCGLCTRGSSHNTYIVFGACIQKQLAIQEKRIVCS